jgi:agmatine deiminase
MPAEWAPHERTLMAWPCRRELWGDRLGAAKAQYAATAIEVIELPIDDSWLRDSGPIFVTGPGGARAGVHFGFNSWGGKFAPWDRDAAVGGLLVDHLGDHRYEAPFVLEGGSICVDGEGTLITTEECLLNPNRNPDLDRAQIEAGLREHLGVETIVWLEHGLVEDRDTDGHVDLIAAFTKPGEVLLQSAPPGAPNHERMAANRERLEAAGIAVVDFPILPYVEVGGEPVAASHLNFYLADGAVIVPTAGVDTDAEALERIAAAYPGRDVVGVRAEEIAAGGGGPHCITQQVPARS